MGAGVDKGGRPSLVVEEEWVVVEEEWVDGGGSEVVGEAVCGG